MAKSKTIKLKGNDYSPVKERLKMFRNDCPRGSIMTEPLIQEWWEVVFKCTIKKDLSEPTSATGTGHSYSTETKSGAKDFEKLETIAIGRALANIWYAWDWEIASAEEMQEYMEYRDQKIEECCDSLSACKDIEELQTAWLDLGKYKTYSKVSDKKDEMKKKLNS